MAKLIDALAMAKREKGAHYICTNIYKGHEFGFGPVTWFEKMNTYEKAHYVFLMAVEHGKIMPLGSLNGATN